MRWEPTTMNDTKRRIREILANCLGIEPEEIQDFDGFLELGLDSLGARRFASLVDEVARSLGNSVSVIDVFRYSNVSELADHVDSRPAAVISITVTAEQSGQVSGVLSPRVTSGTAEFGPG
jgi:acyl carrier protein